MRSKDEDKEGAIYQATVQLSGEVGLSAITMNDIAKEANIATGTLYIYFKNKEELITKTYEHLKGKSINTVMSRFDEKKPYPIMMKTLLLTFLKYSVDNQGEIAFLEQVKHSKYIKDIPEERLAVFDKPMEQLLNEGKRQLLIKEVDNRILLAVIHGITEQFAKLFSDNKLELNQKNIDTIFYVCWGALKS